MEQKRFRKISEHLYFQQNAYELYLRLLSVIYRTKRDSERFWHTQRIINSDMHYPSYFWAVTGGISNEVAQTMLVICSLLDSWVFDGSGHSETTNDVLTVKNPTSDCHHQNAQINIHKCAHLRDVDAKMRHI